MRDAARGLPWTVFSACGHIERDVVSVNYPMTTWCESCGHYVGLGFRRKEAR